MRRYRRLVVGLVVVASGLRAASAFALINPNFTPIHLVKEANVIPWLDLISFDGKALALHAQQADGNLLTSIEVGCRR